jgi:class 3 adenylate cyclase
MAARVASQSGGDDIVISAAVRDDPEVEELLAGERGYAAEPFEVALKGFEGATRLWRVRAASGGGGAAGS